MFEKSPSESLASLLHLASNSFDWVSRASKPFPRLGARYKQIFGKTSWAKAERVCTWKQAAKAAGGVPALKVMLADKCPLARFTHGPDNVIVRVVSLQVFAALAGNKSAKDTAKRVNRQSEDDLPAGETPRFYWRPASRGALQDSFDECVSEVFPNKGKGRRLRLFARAPIYALAESCEQHLEIVRDGIETTRVGFEVAAAVASGSDDAMVLAYIHQYRTFLVSIGGEPDLNNAVVFCGLLGLDKALAQPLVAAAKKAA